MQYNSDITSKVNPILLGVLNEIYSIRSSVENGHDTLIPYEDINDKLKNLNNLSDGRGIKLMKEFDKIYGIKSHYTVVDSHYELLNTSYLDSVYIASILEAMKVLDEIRELSGVFETKAQRLSDDITRTTRSGSLTVEVQAKKMFYDWKDSLISLVSYIERDIEILKNIPMCSKAETKERELNEYFLKDVLPKEEKMLEKFKARYNLDLKPLKDRMNALAQLSPLVSLSGSLNTLAGVLNKIANDIRFLSSGPRSGFGELIIPENEPGSSIMPGKVNPTQCESLTMVAAQVMGNNASIAIANGASLFESSAFKPLVANNLLRSLRLLSDGMKSFRNNCAVGIELIENKKKGNF